MILLSVGYKKIDLVTVFDAILMSRQAHKKFVRNVVGVSVAVLSWLAS